MINLLSPYHRKCSFSHLKLISFISIFVITIVQLLNCSDHKDNALAIVGKRIVTIDDFVTRYKSSRQKVNLPDNGQVRTETFRNMIDEELLIDEAVRRGYHDDPSGKYEYERLKIQELLNTYLYEEVYNNIEVREEELKDLYIRLNTKIKARHLYAASQKQADSLYSELIKGKTFEELAEENFKDPQLRDTGGTLGYFTVDEMDPAFEDAAFALDIGQISKPIRTAQGYSIIQVQDRIIRPLLTESEYIKHRSKLEDYCRYRKRINATQSFVDSLRQHLDISFNEPALNEMLQFIIKRAPNLTVENNDFLLVNDQFQYKELVRSKIGVWDIETLNNYAQYTSEGQLKWIRNQENLEDFIAGLIVRAFILSKEKNSGLYKSQTLETKVKQKMDDYLLKRMALVISEVTIISEDTLRMYFQQNQEQFFIPPKIHLSEIVLNDELKAKEIKIMLLNKESFDKIAREQSVRRWSSDRNGDIGSFTYDELGNYADRLFPLEVDQWVGPIKMDSCFAFFKCTGKYPKRAQTFNEVRDEIINNLKPIWQKKAKQKALEAIRAHIQVVTYPEKLKSIRLN